jgi:ADP-dependent phosphofructokinase/glucokinase
MTQFGKDQFLHCETHRRGRAGKTKIAFRPTVPAVARLIIAADPIWWKLIIRKQLTESVETFLE